MTEADIERTIEDYATCAALAREAGYDGVEIMGSEGYLINEFTAPRTNDRTDDWGGSLENRLRLPVEIMRRVTAADGARLHRHLSRVLDRPRRGRADGRGNHRAGARGGGGRRDDPQSPASAGTRRACRRSRRRCRARPGRFAAARIKQAVAHSGDRVQPHQHAGGGGTHSSRRRRPISSRWRGRGWRTRISWPRPRPGEPTRSTFASPAIRPASITSSPSGWRPASSIRRPGASSSSMCRSPWRASASPSSVPEPQVSPARRPPPSAGTMSRYSRPRERIGGQLNLARNVPGKEEFDETLRYWQAHDRAPRRASAPVEHARRRTVWSAFRRGGDRNRRDAAHARHRRHRSSQVRVVCRYPLGTRRRPGTRVAIIGAGGIGFDVAEYLTSPPAEVAADPAHFRAEWGVDAAIAGPWRTCQGGGRTVRSGRSSCCSESRAAWDAGSASRPDGSCGWRWPSGRWRRSQA